MNPAAILLQHADELKLTADQKAKLEEYAKGPTSMLTEEQKTQAAAWLPKPGGPGGPGGGGQGGPGGGGQGGQGGPGGNRAGSPPPGAPQGGPPGGGGPAGRGAPSGQGGPKQDAPPDDVKK